MTALNLSRKSGVKISGGNYTSANISVCSDVTIEGATFALPFVDGQTTVNSVVARLFQCQRVKLIDCTISGPIVQATATNAIDQTAPAGTPNPSGNVRGLPTGTLLTVDTCSDVEISGDTISSGWRAVAINKGLRLRIEDNDIHELRTTPIAGNVISDVDLLRNHSWDLTPWSFGGAGDHGDVIHLWTTPNQTDHTRRVYIADHLHEQRGANPSLGIYLDTNDNPMGFIGVGIERNVIINSNRQAMRLENCEACNIGGNILLPDDPPPSDPRDLPWITKYGRSSGDVSQNRAFGFSLERDTSFPDIAAANDFSALKPGEGAAAVAAWMQRFRS